MKQMKVRTSLNYPFPNLLSVEVGSALSPIVMGWASTHWPYVVGWASTHPFANLELADRFTGLIIQLSVYPIQGLFIVYFSLKAGPNWTMLQSMVQLVGLVGPV